MRQLALLLLVPTALAFSSLPPADSPHDEITRAAAEAVGWPGGLAALQEAVRAPDVEEFRVEGDRDDFSRIDATDAFRPEHHCDRVPPMDNATAFAATTAYVQERMDAASAAVEVGMEDAVAELGRALHAAQDCFSHSNYVDLDPAGREAFLGAVLHGGQAPAGVVLTAFEPHTDDTTDPQDPYPHDTYAKDAPDKNEESQIVLGDRTKYEWARDGATQASAALLAQFLGPLDDVQRDAVAALRAKDTAGEPAPVWPSLLSIAVVCAIVLWRR